MDDTSRAATNRDQDAASVSDGGNADTRGTSGERRTFAIISHPDAGKTTLTERLLYYGGAIRLAGQVRARGERRRTRSDWLEIERERGISVSSSVMTFEHQGLTFNLLDTPGHEDFREDTYRTLTAVDSAIMVLDAAKGIESQTRKLFEVCRLRNIPIITFINKVDREGRDPFDLLDEIERVLSLEVAPMTWPVGMGTDFHGVYDLQGDSLMPAHGGTAGRMPVEVPCNGPGDERLGAHAPERVVAAFRENAALAMSACPAPDETRYREGRLTPVYFGSALKDYAVGALMEGLARMAPPPRVQPAEPRAVSPEEHRVTGFVFKVQANMDPQHRDRVAYMRLCSGRFRRNMKLHQVRTGRSLTVRSPIFFFARERELAEEARPGDIIGIPNHGTLRVGDTLTEGETLRFSGIPSFAPEILQRIRLDDPLRSKQLGRALESLAEEGVTQVFRPLHGAEWIVGVVGRLQLDTLKARMEAEYGLATHPEPIAVETARWLSADDAGELKRFMERNRNSMAYDRDGMPVFLARDAWELKFAMERWPQLRFHPTRELV